MAAGDYGDPTRVPAIPDIRTGAVEDVLRALKEWVEIRQGARGGGLDRAVTFRDLLNSGIATPGAINGLGAGVIDPIPLIPGTEDPATPPTPTNLMAAGAVSTIILTWDFARGYSRLAHFEVWRSETDALGDAVLIAQVFEPMYADDAGSGAKFYYWVRAVSDAGTSPFNAVSGTFGETAINVEEVIDAISNSLNDSGLLDQLTIKTDGAGRVTGYGPANTPSDDDASSTSFAILANRFLVTGPAADGVIPASPFFVQATPATVNGVFVPKGVYMTDGYLMNGVITNAKIGNLAVDDAKIASVSVAKLTAGKLSVGAYIESTNYLAGDTGFHINANGNSEFSNTTVRGTVYARAGEIGGNIIDATGIRSFNYNGTTAGWRIAASGDVHFNTGVFRGTVFAAAGTFAGQLSAATGTFSGSLSAASGTFTGNVVGGRFMTGSYTGYAWPPGGAGGSYIGPEGLLLGNANTGRYFQVEASGNIHTPGFNIINGVMTVNQANVIDTLNLRGGSVSSTQMWSGSSTAFFSTTVPSVMICFIKAINIFGDSNNSFLADNRQGGVAVNGSFLGHSRMFSYANGNYGGDAGETRYFFDTTTLMVAVNVPAGVSSVSFGTASGAGSNLNVTFVGFLLKR